MPEETALGLLIPGDEDSPDGPNQIGPNAEKTDQLLHLAGAQSKGIVVPGSETVKAKASGWTYMTTPDRVTGIVVPKEAKCSIMVNFWALWTGTGAARAALCVNGIPVRLAIHDGNYRYMAAAGENSSGANWKALSSCNLGLASVEGTVDAAAPPATGYLNGVWAGSGSQGLSWAYGAGQKPEEISNLFDQETPDGFAGGPADLILPEGEYEIGVKFGWLAGEANLSAKNRRLHVWLREFL